MKKTLIVLILSAGLFLAGCTAAQNPVVSGIAQGVDTAFQAQFDANMKTLADAQAKLASATTDADKASAALAVASAQKQTVKDAETKTVIDTGKQIVTTDWATPTAAASTSSLVTLILTAWLLNRKKTT